MILHLKASHWGAFFIGAYANRVSANSLISMYTLVSNNKGYLMLRGNTILGYPDLDIRQHLTIDPVNARMMNLFKYATTWFQGQVVD